MAVYNFVGPRASSAGYAKAMNTWASEQQSLLEKMQQSQNVDWRTTGKMSPKGVEASFTVHRRKLLRKRVPHWATFWWSEVHLPSNLSTSKGNGSSIPLSSSASLRRLQRVCSLSPQWPKLQGKLQLWPSLPWPWLNTKEIQSSKVNCKYVMFTYSSGVLFC